MEISFLTDYLNILGDDCKTLASGEPPAGADDFAAVLAKILNDYKNKPMPAEAKKILQLTEDLQGIDKDKLMKMADDGIIKYSEEKIKAVGYIIASIIEALNFLKSNYDISGLISDNGQGLKLDAQKIPLLPSTVHQNVDSLTRVETEAVNALSNSIEKAPAIELTSALDDDIKQLMAKVEKAASGAEKVVKEAADSGIHIQEKKNFIFQNSSERQAKQHITDASQLGKNNNQVIISKPEQNKGNNILNVTGYYSASENGADSQMQGETSFSNYFKESQSGKDGFIAYDRNGTKDYANELQLPDSRQGFSILLNKSEAEEAFSTTQRVMTQDIDDINGEKILIAKPNESSLKVSIEPDGMGTLDIELTLEKGFVNAHIFASETAGKNFLDNNLANILNNLLREGLNIGKFSITLGDRRNNSNEDYKENSQKTSKELQESAINKHYKNRLISIFA